MKQEEKQPFEEMHKEDVKRYEKQLKEYEKKGYYTRIDGAQSNSVSNIGSKRKAEKEEESKRKSRKSRRSGSRR